MKPPRVSFAKELGLCHVDLGETQNSDIAESLTGVILQEQSCQLVAYHLVIHLSKIPATCQELFLERYVCIC